MTFLHGEALPPCPWNDAALSRARVAGVSLPTDAPSRKTGSWPRERVVRVARRAPGERLVPTKTLARAARASRAECEFTGYQHTGPAQSASGCPPLTLVGSRTMASSVDRARDSRAASPT